MSTLVTQKVVCVIKALLNFWSTLVLFNKRFINRTLSIKVLDGKKKKKSAYKQIKHSQTHFYL